MGTNTPRNVRAAHRSRTDDLHITSVPRCDAHGHEGPVYIVVYERCCWRSTAVGGGSGHPAGMSAWRVTLTGVSGSWLEEPKDFAKEARSRGCHRLADGR